MSEKKDEYVSSLSNDKIGSLYSYLLMNRVFRDQLLAYPKEAAWNYLSIQLSQADADEILRQKQKIIRLGEEYDKALEGTRVRQKGITPFLGTGESGDVDDGDSKIVSKKAKKK